MNKENGFRILLYHSVGEVDPNDDLGTRISPEAFTSQMEYLAMNGYNVLTLKDAFFSLKNKEHFPEKTVVITFDDGYKDNFTDVIPILDRFSFKATFFVTIDLIGGVKTKPERYWQYWECLSWDDIRKIESKGHIIGSHSVSHINLIKTSADNRVKQIKTSKEKIEANLKTKIDFFSYPYGHFNQDLIKALQSVGYKAACTSLVGLNKNSVNPYKLRRTEVARYHNMDDFKARLDGRDDWIRFLKREFYV